MKKVSAVPSDPPEVLELFSLIALLSSKATGFDGVVVRSVALIVPSSQNEGGRNIVLFASNLSKTSKLQVLRAEPLPK